MYYNCGPMHTGFLCMLEMVHLALHVLGSRDQVQFTGVTTGTVADKILFLLLSLAMFSGSTVVIVRY